MPSRRSPIGACCALVTLAVLLAACGGGGDSAVDATSTTGGAATSTSASAPPSTSSSSTSSSTTEPEASCPPPPQPADAAAITNGKGDFDGDGVADAASAYRTGPADAPIWHVRVELSSGTQADSIVPRDLGRAAGIGDASIIGAVDVNSDGHDELWVQVGSGTAVQLVALYLVQGCAMVPVSADGTAVVFSVGGEPASLAGVGCDDIDVNGVVDFVVQLEAKSTDGGQTYQTMETEYVLSGAQLGLISALPGSAVPTQPGFSRYSSFHCGPIDR